MVISASSNQSSSSQAPAIAIPPIFCNDKYTAIASFDSAVKCREWCTKMRCHSPFDKMVAHRRYHALETCLLEVRLEYQNKQMRMDSILSQAGIPFIPQSGTSSSSSSSSSSTSSSSSMSMTSSSSLATSSLSSTAHSRFIDSILQNSDRIYKIEGKSYRILRLISESGCYGDIFLACDQETAKEVVIKILRSDSDREHEMLKKIQERGGHMNIVQYIGSDTIMDKRWIVMEYIRGEMMWAYVRHSPWTSQLEKQYKSAVEFLSKIRVDTERENERENILIKMVDEEPVVKLIDFGTLARG